jgi:hypothetical protein
MGKNDMKPIDFAGMNTDLMKPKEMTDEECGSLPCFRNGLQVISCWKMNLKERVRSLFAGKIWLSVYSGETQPPVALSTTPLVIVKKKGKNE